MTRILLETKLHVMGRIVYIYREFSGSLEQKEAIERIRKRRDSNCNSLMDCIEDEQGNPCKAPMEDCVDDEQKNTGTKEVDDEQKHTSVAMKDDFIIDEQKNQFKRFPRQLVLSDIFRRLEPSDVYTATTVCKEWKDIVRDKTTPTAFMLQLAHFSSEEEQKLTNLLLVVDKQGKCHRPDSGGLQTFSGPLWAFDPATTSIHILDPMSKKRKKVSAQGYLTWDGNSSDTVYMQFKALKFDNTSQVTMLFGFQFPNKLLLTTYKDGSWKETYYDNTTSPKSPKGDGVFSWDCCFWIDETNGSVASYSLHKDAFKSIPYPACDCNRSRNPACVNAKWQINGCDGNVILVHNKTNKLVAWRLLQAHDNNNADADTYHQWQHLSVELSNVARSLSTKNYSYSINKSGWWIVCQSSKNSQDDYIYTIFNQNGQVIYSMPKSEIISQFKIPSRCLHVQCVWPFEVNNIWWP